MARKKTPPPPARPRAPKETAAPKPDVADDDPVAVESPPDVTTADEKPDASALPFPIVAIGASAGGIEATSRLLEALPRDTGMAFVVIQHLSPAHESMLSDILARITMLPVAEAKDGTPVEANHVYVIPPNRTLGCAKGLLTLSSRTEQRGQARPIDDFMRSLADVHGHKSIGVVLSGSATDGTLGLEEIKAAGGITFAQDTTAEQSSMPRSAIAAGVVDFVLPPDEIAHELARIARHPYVAPSPAAEASIGQDPAFTRVIDMLRQSTGVDFSKYKRNTLQRRITRRMVLHKTDGLRDYVRLLQSKPEEVGALYQDVLINVTSFFRNQEAVASLRRAIEATDAERESMQQVLETAIPEDGLYVIADPVRLDQIFTNLLANASKFTRHGGRVWLTAEKEPPAAASGRPLIAVHVRDNGVGIEPAMLPRIFDLFVQADNSERSRTGIGLGLTLAKRLVDLHHGTIEARSAGIGMGSEFIVRLPLFPADRVPKADARSGAEAEAARAPRRVLIVDDNRDSGESLRHLFELTGHETRFVTEGAMAVPATVDFKPDVVVLDIALADMDGYRVARELRDDPRTKDAYIVAVTGYGRDDDRARSRDAGMDAHMTKPVDIEALMAQVAKGRAKPES